MRVFKFKNIRVVAAAGLLGAVYLGVGWGADLLAQAQERASRVEPRPPELSARHFRADLMVRHRRFAGNGVPLPVPAPDLRMRVEREDRSGRWRTSIVMADTPAALVQAPAGRTSLTNPFAVARVEIDDGEEEPRLYDRAGRRVRPATEADLRVLGLARTARGGSGQTETVARGGRVPFGAGFLVESARRDDRRREFRQRFGQPTGRVRGLDRFVTDGPGGRQEALVTPDTVLPVEVSLSAPDGVDVRTTMAYEGHGRFGHVRRLTRSEQGFGRAETGRAVTEVELANVVVSDEVPR